MCCLVMLKQVCHQAHTTQSKHVLCLPTRFPQRASTPYKMSPHLLFFKTQPSFFKFLLAIVLAFFLAHRHGFQQISNILCHAFGGRYLSRMIIASMLFTLVASYGVIAELLGAHLRHFYTDLLSRQLGVTDFLECEQPGTNSRFSVPLHPVAKITRTKVLAAEFVYLMHERTSASPQIIQHVLCILHSLQFL